MGAANVYISNRSGHFLNKTVPSSALMVVMYLEVSEASGSGATVGCGTVVMPVRQGKQMNYPKIVTPGDLTDFGIMAKFI